MEPKEKISANNIRYQMFQQLLENGVKNIILILAFGIVLLLFLQSVYGSVTVDANEKVIFLKDVMILNIIMIVIFIFVAVWIKKKRGIPVPGERFLHKVTIVYMILMLGLVVCLQVMPRADQLKCLAVAESLCKGEYYDWASGAYCNIYPNQNGFVLILVALMQIFGFKNWMVIQVLNIPALVISAAACAKTILMLFEDKKFARYTYLFLLTFFPLNCYVTFVYGTLLGLAAATTGIYFIISYWKEARRKKGFLGILLIAFAVICKSNYLIFLVATIGILLYDGVVNARYQSGLMCLCAIMVYLGSSLCISVVIETVTGQEQAGGIPSAAWVAMGLQESERGPGWYNGYNARILQEHDFNVNAAKKSISEEISQRLQCFWENKTYALNFFGRKTASQWNDGTFQGFWVNNIQKERRMVIWAPITEQWMETGTIINDFLIGIINCLLSVLWLGVLAFLWYCRKDTTVYQLIFCIVFLGGFIFHLFWEAKGQYTVVYAYLMIPYMIKGYQKILHSLCRERKEKNEKEIL